MAFKFNALTGNLDLVNESTGGSTTYTPGTPSDWSPAPTTVGAALDQLADRIAKYEQTFVIGDWVGPSGGEYSLTIPEASHLKGVNPHIFVFEDVGGFFEEVTVSITVANTGTIVLRVLEVPDLRFAGKLTII